MKKADYCRRFLFAEQDVRGQLVILEDSYQGLLANKNYPLPAQRLLGEFLAAGVLLSTTIKFDGRLVLQARGEGQISVIMAECTSTQKVRGIVRYDDIDPAANMGQLMGSGVLAITIEPDKGESYQGIVALDSSGLAASLEDYFQRSEQLPSLFFLAADSQRSAGLLLQQMPVQLQEDRQAREDAWNTISALAATLTVEELLQLDDETLLYRLFNELSLTLFPSQAVEYQCSCNRERTARALLLLGQDEVMGIVAEQGGVEISCEFCGKQYNFGPRELGLLFEHPDSAHMH